MELVEFEEQNVIFAKDQPQYRPLPAHVDAAGVVTCCWRLSSEEVQQIVRTGMVWHQIHTFKHALQPQLLSVEKPI